MIYKKMKIGLAEVKKNIKSFMIGWLFFRKTTVSD